MSSAMLFALVPLITLSVVILALMLVIAFHRNLALTCGISVAGLAATQFAILFVDGSITSTAVTPLIVVDHYALLFSSMIVIASGFICLISYGYHCQRREPQDEFYLLLLLAALGGMTLAHSVHFASMILGVELLGVALYAMIAYPNRGIFSLEAGLKYLILSGVSSAFMMFGIALLYAAFGTLSFSAMAEQTEPTNSLFVLVGAGMLLSGIAFKLSLVPFHMWTPDVYEGAPAPATAFLATVSKGGIFAVLLRFFTSADGYQYATIIEGLFWIAILSILVGNLLALMQTSIKRLLAYSSIAHIGYLLVAFLAASFVGGKTLAIEAAIFFLMAYFLTTVGAFGVVTLMSPGESDHDSDNLKQYEGLFWRRPMLATFFTIMLLSLAGIPLTAGFVGKFYIFAAGVQSELWALLAMVVVGSGIGLFYYLRIVFAMTKQTGSQEVIVIPATGGWAMAAVTLSILVLGVYPTPFIAWVSEVARAIP